MVVIGVICVVFIVCIGGAYSLIRFFNKNKERGDRDIINQINKKAYEKLQDLEKEKLFRTSTNDEIIKKLNGLYRDP